LRSVLPWSLVPTISAFCFLFSAFIRSFFDILV
jgi:hypothetical protein